MAAGRIHVGTSGWQYRHWRGPFYPPGLAADALLPSYAETFGSVEVNSTFYGLPSPDAAARWRDATPPGFVFACKASRYITHMKKLKDPQDALARFFGVVRALAPKLGPVIFQLPPRWRVNAGRLEAFLAALPAGQRAAFEFRDDSWWIPEIYALLRRADAALCPFDLAGRRSPVWRTAGFAYVRLHGPGGAYQGSYDDRTLGLWARRFARWRDEGADVYCYFDNDERGFAARDAQRLIAMLDGR